MSTCVPIVLINVIFVINVLMSCESILPILHSAIVAYELIRHREYLALNIYYNSPKES